MALKRTTTDAVDMMYRDIISGNPERLQKVEHHRLNMEVASLIYNLRTKAGLSQTDLAKRVDTTQSVISRLEDADYEGHSLSMLAKIASALGYRLGLSAKRLDISKAKLKQVKSKLKTGMSTRKVARI